MTHPRHALARDERGHDAVAGDHRHNRRPPHHRHGPVRSPRRRHLAAARPLPPLSRGLRDLSADLQPAPLLHRSDGGRRHRALGRAEELRRSAGRPAVLERHHEQRDHGRHRGRDPGRARRGAGAVLQSASQGLGHRARHPGAAHADHADHRRRDVAGAAEPGLGAGRTGPSPSWASSRRTGWARSRWR